MAKDLPYFKFYTNEWISGDITMCSLEAQGVFINLCALYWSKKGVLSFTSVVRRYNERNIKELIDEEIIQSDGKFINIRFLDEQFMERDKLSEQNRQNVLKRHKANKRGTTVIRKDTSVNEGNTTVYNIEEKRREEKKEIYKEKVNPPASQSVPTPPTEGDFLAYAMKNAPDLVEEAVRLKYRAWIADNWHDGNGKKVKNWKAKLLQTIPYIDRKQVAKKIDIR